MNYVYIPLLFFTMALDTGNCQSINCRDKIDSYSCYHWLVNGMCSDVSYRNLMIESCQKTCNLCPPVVVKSVSACRDNRKKCISWRQQNHCKEYSRYYNFMKTNCQRSCLFCEDKQCIDKKSRCGRYRDLGYCTENHQYHRFMKKNCEKSCDFCSPVKESLNHDQSRIEEYVKEFECDFEEDECDWSNSHFEDTADWQVGVDHYGPRSGYNNSAKYLHLDTKYEGYYALLWLPWELVLPDNEKDKGDMCFHFWYQMDEGRIIVSVKANPFVSNKYSEPHTKFSTTLKTKTWKHVKVSVPVSDRYQLYLKGVKGHPESYLAIDNFFFTSGMCY